MYLFLAEQHLITSLFIKYTSTRKEMKSNYCLSLNHWQNTVTELYIKLSQEKITQHFMFSKLIRHITLNQLKNIFLRLSSIKMAY
jgi:hypothetical protein